jgi:Fe2+ transport system protein FeoA
MPIKADALPLSALRAGERGIVVALAAGRNLLSRMTALGFTPGAEIIIIQNYGHGPLIVQVRQGRVALGRGEAQKIYVHKGQND